MRIGASTERSAAEGKKAGSGSQLKRQQQSGKGKGRGNGAEKKMPAVQDGTQMYTVVRAGRQRPQLILLDLNGTLLLRSEKTIKGALERPDMKVEKRHYYFRPFAREFVHWLAAQDNAVVAFYTSMTALYAVPARQWLVEGLNPATIPALYDQPWNQRDETTAYRFKRNLPRLWKEINRRLRRAFSGTEIEFNATNTMTIDDSAWKMRAHPDNVVVIPEYEAAHVVHASRQASTFPAAELFDGETRQPRRTQDDDGVHIEAALLPCVQNELDRLLARWAVENDHVAPLVREMQANLDALFPRLAAPAEGES